jgi:2-phosphoglycerate kinase
VEEACDSLDVEDEESIIEAFRQDCRKVRDGCNFDISKCFKDGKPLIIDGSHVNPENYIKQIKCESKDKLEYRIVTEAEPFNESSPKTALQTMQQKMQAIDQRGSLIIPFLLTIDP